MTVGRFERSLRWATAITLAVFTALLAGCGSPSGAASGTAVHDFAVLFDGYFVDYEPERSPAALADRSLLVVQGRIAHIGTGRTFGASATDPATETSIVMAFDVRQVLRGSLPGGAGGTVFVELPAPMSRPAAEFDHAAPRDRDAVLYLKAAATRDDTGLVDPDAGRPAGQPLYRPTNPQGFVIDADGMVVQVLETTELRGAKLAHFLPDSTAFPSAR